MQKYFLTVHECCTIYDAYVYRWIFKKIIINDDKNIVTSIDGCNLCMMQSHVIDSSNSECDDFIFFILQKLITSRHTIPK